MTHDWIVHELEELAQYARSNHMAALASLLIEARTMAMLEIANLPDAGASADTADKPFATPRTGHRCAPS
ncbi:MAG: hypothetical protein JJU19_07140 [Pararhodobacter sp.]|nr:hypothetical protein [Pararhodobacter sp.]